MRAHIGMRSDGMRDNEVKEMYCVSGCSEEYKGEKEGMEGKLNNLEYKKRVTERERVCVWGGGP